MQRNRATLGVSKAAWAWLTERRGRPSTSPSHHRRVRRSCKADAPDCLERTDCCRRERPRREGRPDPTTPPGPPSDPRLRSQPQGVVGGTEDATWAAQVPRGGPAKSLPLPTDSQSTADDQRPPPRPVPGPGRSTGVTRSSGPSRRPHRRQPPGRSRRKRDVWCVSTAPVCRQRAKLQELWNRRTSLTARWVPRLRTVGQLLTSDVARPGGTAESPGPRIPVDGRNSASRDRRPSRSSSTSSRWTARRHRRRRPAPAADVAVVTVDQAAAAAAVAVVTGSVGAGRRRIAGAVRRRTTDLARSSTGSSFIYHSVSETYRAPVTKRT